MRKIFRYFTAYFLVGILLIQNIPVAHGEANLELESKSAVLMEAETGKILFEYNPHDKNRPASVTKVMTLLLAYDAIERGDISEEDTVTISEFAAGYGGSTIFLEADEQIKFKELLRGMAIASGNDAAVATSEYVGGSMDGFVNQMNARAKELGMNDTNFVNPCGLDADGHVTSAHDIALMSRELITKHPQIFEHTKVWNSSLKHQWRKGEGISDLTNTNKLIKSYEGMTGLKTGYTSLAKYSISGTAERNGLKLIGVIMGAETRDARSRDLVKILNYGFGNYEMLTEEKKGHAVGEIEVIKGDKERIQCIISDDLKVLVDKSKKITKDQIETKIDMPDKIMAPVEKGQQVGEVKYYFGEELLGSSSIIVNESAEMATFKDMIRKIVSRWAS